MTDKKINLDGLSVCIGMPAGKDLSPLVVKSLLGTYSLCCSMGIPCQFAMIAGNSVIQWARDEVVDLFLQTEANRLFWIDSDIVWEPNDFMRLLALSQEQEVVCATYPAKKDETTFYVLMDKEVEQDDLGLIDIKGVGMGFFVMHRKVVDELCEKADKIYDEITGKTFHELFRIGKTKEGKRKGEDMFFFEDIASLGYKIKLDPSIDLGHVGHKTYEGSITDALQ